MGYYRYGGGSDRIVEKAAREMKQAEQIISAWAPAPLKMALDDYLWKETDYISVKQLWEYLCTYCYLPRVANYNVLEEAICQGANSSEFFALAAGYDEQNQRYLDLKLGQPIFSVNLSDLLVKVEVAKNNWKQKRKLLKQKQPILEALRFHLGILKVMAALTVVPFIHLIQTEITMQFMKAVKIPISLCPLRWIIHESFVM